MGDIPDWAMDNNPAPVEQNTAGSSVPDWAVQAPVKAKPATISKPTISDQSAPAPKKVKGRTAPVGGKIYQIGDTPAEQFGLDDNQAKQAQDYQNYVMNNSVQSNLSPDKEADVVMSKFPSLFGTNDPQRIAAHKKEITGAIQYYRNGGTLPIQFNVNESDLPEAITVTANKDQVAQQRADKAAEAVPGTSGITSKLAHGGSDLGAGIYDRVEDASTGLYKLIDKAGKAVGLIDPNDDTFDEAAHQLNQEEDQRYYNPDSTSAKVGRFIGDNAALLPLNELGPATKLLGAGKLASMGDLATQGAIISELNSGGDASGQDVLANAFLTSLLGVIHGEGGKLGKQSVSPEEDAVTLAQYGIDPQDLPEGVTPKDALDALHGSKQLQNEAEAFKSSIKEPTPETAFKNPDGDMAQLEANLKAEAEKFSGKPLEEDAAPTAPAEPAPEEGGISRKEADAQFNEATTPPKKLTLKQMEAKLKAEAEAFVNRDVVAPEKPAEASSKQGAPKDQEQPSEGPTEAPKPPEPDEVASRLTEALNRAGEVRPDQDAMYKAERAKRFARIRDIPPEIQGRERNAIKKQIMAGELPKATFEEVGSQFTEEEITALHNKIETSLTDEGQKLTASRGLEKLLSGAVPTSSELDLLKGIYDPSFIKAALKHRSAIQKAGGLITKTGGTLKSLQATADLSAPLRQGAPLIHTKAFWSSFLHMFSYAGPHSEEAFNALENNIKARPTYQRMLDSGLFLAEHGHRLTNREEQFMDTWITKLPIVRHSDRAYTGFLNKLRADTFDTLVAKAEQAGLDVPDENIAKYINTATGRGDLGGVERIANELNAVLFSPRFVKSRIDLLNPFYYKKLDPFTRKEALKSLVAYGTFATSTMGLAAYAGADTSLDPFSKNFLKIKIGNTRYDVGAGFGQLIKLAAVLSADAFEKGKELATTGEITKPKWKDRDKTAADTLLKFGRSKLSPIAGIAADFFTGSDFSGNKITLKQEVMGHTLPLFLQDWAGIVQDKGWLEGSVMAVPALFGVGVQTYPDKGNVKPVPAPPGTPEPDWSKEPAPTEAKPKVSDASLPDWAKTASKYETSGNANAVHLAEGLGLHVNDAGIRSIGTQRYYYEHFNGVAKPGTSPHGEGRAIDIRVSRDMTPAQIKQEFEAKGYQGVKIITKLHGTGPHWHIQWDSYKEAA